jgi:hypothetical protein
MTLTTLTVQSSTNFKTYTHKYSAIEFKSFTTTIANCLNFLVQKNAISFSEKMTLQKNEKKAFEVIKNNEMFFTELN